MNSYDLDPNLYQGLYPSVKKELHRYFNMLHSRIRNMGKTLVQPAASISGSKDENCLEASCQLAAADRLPARQRLRYPNPMVF
jgi:hypothetical protein